MKLNQFIFVSILIIVTALSNIILADIPNFSPIASVALFSGFYFSNKKIALIIPVACMLVSDYFIGFHSYMWAVYLSFVFIAIIGVSMKKAQPINILLNTLISSALFFFITNTAVWISGSYYTKDLSGLAMCLTMGIPFFKYTLLSSTIFSTVLFGGLEIINKSISKFFSISNES